LPITERVVVRTSATIAVLIIDPLHPDFRNFTIDQVRPMDFDSSFVPKSGGWDVRHSAPKSQVAFW